MLELRFPDGQTHDFVVKDFAGKVIWRWSEGRMFTSAMRSETLKGKGETMFSRELGHQGTARLVHRRRERFAATTSPSRARSSSYSRSCSLDNRQLAGRIRSDRFFFECQRSNNGEAFC